jgi:DNA polymerase-3 subunit gamma/tau
MTYLVLARKWRPQTFDDIVGQQHVSETLKNAIKTNRVAHAFLFTGVRGVGKTTAARVLAKALNCETGPTPTPCNKCSNCEEITAGNAVDVLEIDGASNTGVNDVREIIENVRYQPAKSRFKIYIIDEVHMLSTSAFNALLKTLEEPPAHVKFIFATTDPHKVPHTIHSRCQRYDFRRIPAAQIVDRLLAITKADKITASERGLYLIAREAEGSMRDAQSLLDQVIAFAGNKIRDEDVAAALGLADRALLFDLAAAIIDHQPAKALAVVDQLHRFGYDLRRFVRELLEHARNLSVAKLGQAEALLEDVPAEEREQIQRQAERISHEDIDRVFRTLLETEAEVARVAYPKLIVDMVVIKLATMTPVLPADELLRRIEAAQRGGSADGGSSASTTAAARTGGARPATASPRNAPSGGAPTRQEAVGGSWQGFVDFVRRNKITLSAYVEAAVAPQLDGDAIHLRVPAGHFYDYLSTPTNLNVVKELAQKFFARAMRVDVESHVAAAAEPEAPQPTAAELHEAALSDPTVQAAVQILGGEVQEVRARKRSRKENA